jgi:hypothetical protein
VNPRKIDRNAKMVAAFLAGATFVRIGLDFGVRDERARFIVRRDSGLPQDQLNAMCRANMLRAPADEKPPTKRKSNHDPLASRVRYLPTQLEAVRRKVAMLENEARRYGLHDLVRAA